MKNDMDTRKSQWARFHAWEERHAREAIPRSSEAVVRAAGEMIEFYLRVSGGLAPTGLGPTAKAEVIRRLRDALRFVPLPQ